MLQKHFQMILTAAKVVNMDDISLYLQETDMINQLMQSIFSFYE
jgi:hypothetical protein